ncbi:unnamed protein product [Camellia sinensis]
MVAMKCRDQLHELVKEEIEKKDSSMEEWKIAMERSFNRMDNEVIAWNDSKQSFGQNVVSLTVELKEAEAEAKKMEEEMYRLQESLEERNGQLQASASTVGMVELLGLSEISTVMEFDFSKPISPCFGKAQVEFTEPGICHGFVLWIDWVMDIDNSIIKDTGSKELSCWPSQSQLESMDQVEVTFQRKLRRPSTHQTSVLVKIHSPMRSDPNHVVKWVPDCSTIVAARIASEKLLR